MAFGTSITGRENEVPVIPDQSALLRIGANVVLKVRERDAAISFEIRINKAESGFP
jgi:hypothetical protein